MNSVAISLIRNYIEEKLFAPSLSWNKREFKRRSYEQWAAYEILERIMDHPMDAPIDVIDHFIFEMNLCSCAGGEDESRTFIFQIAASLAEELLLLFV